MKANFTYTLNRLSDLSTTHMTWVEMGALLLSVSLI